MKRPQLFYRVLIAAWLGLCFASAPVRADINGFGNFSGFTINQSDQSSVPAVSPGTIHLTSDGNGEARSIFFNTPQNVSQFTASFTYQDFNGEAGGAAGACFVIQNSAAGVHAIGGTDDSMGYSNNGAQAGIGQSLAIPLGIDLFSDHLSSTGFFTNGIVGNGLVSTSPVSLISDDPINVTLTYDGAFLNETLFDPVTSASFTTGYLANVPTIVGGSTAYVGFTAGSNVGPDQAFSNFHYNAPEPSSLALLGIGLAGFIARRFGRRRVTLSPRSRTCR